MTNVGVVAIGRNEGERLRRCLTSAKDCGPVVYVDSNSSDNSVRIALDLGITVVQLDMSLPFSAARARNEGFHRLMTLFPETELVQFVDGDCEIVPLWIERGKAEFESDESLGVIAGRRRERHPMNSIYNRLCDIEWDTPIGEAKACGGDAMMRTEILQRLGGFNSSVIAGEEPELCVRVRASGWTVRRIDAEMTLHDAAMTRFGQWWRRMERSGHAYAQGVAIHGGPPEFHWVRQQRSILFWGALVPLVALVFAWPSRGLSLCLLIGYALLIAKVIRHYRSRGFRTSDASLAGTFDILAKFPQVLGVIKFHVNRMLSRETPLIEYKGAAE